MQINLDSDIISGKFCHENTIRSFTIKDEGAYVEVKDDEGNVSKKLELTILLQNAEKMKWRPNKTSQKVLVKVFGQDSKNWLGKQVKVNIQPSMGSYSVIVDELDTMALNGKNAKGSSTIL